MTQYNIYSYIKGQNGFGLYLSDTSFSATLTASTDTTVTVPATAGVGLVLPTSKYSMLAVIRTTPADVWVAVNQTAAIPAGGTFASTTSQLLDRDVMGIAVNGNDVLHFITAASDVVVSVAFYVLPGQG